jgi:hypothetical protein
MVGCMCFLFPFSPSSPPEFERSEANKGRFMAASKVLGEETIAATAARERQQQQAQQGQQRGSGGSES